VSTGLLSSKYCNPFLYSNKKPRRNHPIHNT